MRTNGQRRPEEIEAEIERTRTDLNETLHAIEERFTPGQLVDQGLHYLRDSGANEYLHNLRATATRDPMPLALVGVGLAWLMLSSRRGPPPLEEPTSIPAEPSTLSSVKEKVSQTTQKLSQTTQRVSHAAQAARERASRMGESAKYQAERLRGSYEHLVNEQPLALGAIGLALGAVLAAAAPRTRLEERLIGDEASRAEDEEAQALERERAEMDREMRSSAEDRLVAEAPLNEPQPAVPPPYLGTMPP